MKFKINKDFNNRLNEDFRAGVISEAMHNVIVAVLPVLEGRQVEYHDSKPAESREIRIAEITTQIYLLCRDGKLTEEEFWNIYSFLGEKDDDPLFRMKAVPVSEESYLQNDLRLLLRWGDMDLGIAPLYGEKTGEVSKGMKLVKLEDDLALDQVFSTRRINKKIKTYDVSPSRSGEVKIGGKEILFGAILLWNIIIAIIVIIFLVGMAIG